MARQPGDFKALKVTERVYRVGAIEEGLAAVFGSYGWSGESVKLLNEMLRAMKVELVSEGVSVRYVPGPDALAQCASLGATVAQRLATLCSGG